MNFAALIISRLEQSVTFINRVVSEAPRLREFFQVWDTVPAIRDQPDAVDPGRLTGWSSSRTCRSPMTASAWRRST